MTDLLPLTLLLARAEEANNAPEFADVCAFEGCKRPPRPTKSLCSTHNKQHQRGTGMFPVGSKTQAPIPPCKTCRGKDFGIQTLRRRETGEQYLARYCICCRKRSSREWALANQEASRVAKKKWRDANRDSINARRRKYATKGMVG